jgi:pyruvate/2-oxoglutarate dehydrogenase complex dihydrolipoamide dehydrogenase (E3) component
MYDVIVIGAGPTGKSTRITLSALGEKRERRSLFTL